jgi:hypothetical protein
VKAIVAALREQGIPASVSQTAGTFVCNHVMYGLLHALNGRSGAKGGFIHIPYLPEQAAAHPGEASMAVQRSVRRWRRRLPSPCARRGCENCRRCDALTEGRYYAGRSGDPPRGG